MPSALPSLLSVALLAAVAGGCEREEPPWSKRRGAAGTSAAAGAGVTGPGASAPRAPAPAGTISGTVAETMNAGGYTYARVTAGGKDVWAAGPQTPLAVGAPVSLAGGTLMRGFRSDTLDRTFDEIYFLSAWDSAGAAGPYAGAASPHAAGAASPHAGGAMAKPGGLAPGERVEAAAGGQTVAQVFADRAGLAGKPVTVRGKVVKFNGGIMGKNWLHLQDGTGAAGTNDLIVTTQAEAAVGEVVTARGTLVLDKDLGAGYRYDVLVEDAALSR